MSAENDDAGNEQPDLDELDLEGLRAQLAEAEQGGDDRAKLRILHHMGARQFNEGEPAEAQEKFGAALTVARDLGERVAEAACLSNIAACAGQQGEFSVARSLLAEALEIRRELEDQMGAAACLHELGMLAARQGDEETARNAYGEALQLRQAGGDRAGEAMTFNNLGLMAVDKGRADEGMALIVLAYGLARIAESSIERQMLASVQRLADEMGYDDPGLDELVERVLASYREDRGESLVAAAFA